MPSILPCFFGDIYKTIILCEHIYYACHPSFHATSAWDLFWNIKIKHTLVSTICLKKTIQPRKDGIIILVKKKTLIFIKKRLLFWSKKTLVLIKKNIKKKNLELEGSFGRSGFLPIDPHFVRKGCDRHLRIAILPQFLTIDPHFVRKGCADK